MNILHLHTKMVAGGIEAMVCGLANAQCKNNNVIVCTIFNPGSEDVFLNRLDPRIVKATIGKKEFGFTIKEVFRIAAFIKRAKCDIVHIHGCFQYYFFAVLLLHKRVEFVYTIHSDAKMENQYWDQKLFFFKNFCFKNKWITPVTISPSSQQSFIDLYHCSCEMIPNGISRPSFNDDPNVVDDYRITKNTRVFIHPGRITKAKNQVVLCQVFFDLISKGKDLVLIIIGPPEEEAILKSLQPFFSDRIIYLGERKDVVQIMSRADAFCLPSIWEGLPVTLLESISVGCIPICSPVGGVPDVIKDGENGFLSESYSREDYSNAVLKYLNTPYHILLQIKENARATFEHYTIEKTAQRYLNLYEQLLCNH